jgi:hypothetical protein
MHEMQEEPDLIVQHNQTATHEMMAVPCDPRWETDHLLAMPFDQYQRYRFNGGSGRGAQAGR